MDEKKKVKVIELWDGFYRSSIADRSDRVVICEEYLCFCGGRLCSFLKTFLLYSH